MAYEDEEQAELPVDEELEVEESDEDSIFIDAEAANIVPDLKATEEGRKVLKDIADQVCEDFDEAWESSEEYREKVADNYKLYSGKLPAKMKPFENCSNIHIPIMLEGVSRLESRTYAEVFLNGDSLISAQPVEPGEIAMLEASMVTKHSNWQLTEQITDFRRQMQRACHFFYNIGDVSIHSFYDPRRRMNRHEVLSCDDLVTPYTHVSTMPDYSDVPYKIKILRYRKADLLDMKQLGWEDVDKIIEREAPGYDDDPESKLRTSIAEVQGIVAPDSSKRNGEYKLYWYEGSFQFPGTDVCRPITAIVDSSTKAVARLYIREEIDWQDQIRFDRQVKERGDFMAMMEQYNAAVEMYPQAKAEYDQYALEREAAVAVMSQTLSQEEMIAADIGLQADDPGPPQPPVAPIPPGWMAPETDELGMVIYPEPEAPRRVPMEMFSHAICMENMLGTLGLSPGQMYADMNRAANNTFNQLSDQATLSNVGTYIASDLVDFEAGDFEIGPGVVNRLTGISPEQVANAIVPLRPGQANPQLSEIVQQIYGWSQTAFGATAALSGEPGKSGETYRGFSSRVEQALKQLSVTGRKFVEGVEQVAKNNAKLNSVFLPDEEIVYVSGGLQNGDLQKVEVTRKMYQRNYRIQIRADMRFASQQQRVMEADQLLQLPQMVPPLQGNLSYWYTATEEKLKAQGATRLLDTLGPRPPMPTTPLGVPPPPPPMPPGMAPPPGAPPGAGGPPPPSGQPIKPPGIPGPRQEGE
jgi:hypothetical protein